MTKHQASHEGSSTSSATKPPNPALYPSSPRVTGGKAMTTARRWSIGKRAGRSPRRIKQTGDEKGRGIVNFRIEPAGMITVLAGNNTKKPGGAAPTCEGVANIGP